MAATQTRTAMSSLKTLLKQELFSGDSKTPALQILNFITALKTYYSSTWSQSDVWNEPTVSKSLEIAGVKLSELTEDATPEELIHATCDVLKENWQEFSDDLLQLPQFENNPPDLKSANGFLENAGRASNASSVETNLSAFLTTFTTDPLRNEEQENELPTRHESALIELLEKAKKAENSWTGLGLASTAAELDRAIRDLQKTQTQNKNVLTPEETAKLKSLAEAQEKLRQFRETLKNERKKIVEDLLSSNFLGSDRIEASQRNPIFALHDPQIFKLPEGNWQQPSLTAALSFWKYLAKNVDDPSFYFGTTVTERYKIFIQKLGQKTNELQPESQTLGNDIKVAIGLSTAAPLAPAADSGGGETNTDQTNVLDAAEYSFYEGNWNRLLARLDVLGQSISGALPADTQASIASSLQQFAEDLGVSDPRSSLAEIISQLISLPFSDWIGEKSASEIEILITRFGQLLDAQQALIQQAQQETPATPGEAAAKAQAAIDEKLPETTQQADAEAELDPDKLKNLSKLTKGHAALTGIALVELEKELLKQGYTKEEVADFIELNQAAVAQYLWAKYLDQVQTGDTTLSSNEVFKLALNGSYFFVDKFELEKGVRSEALGPDSLQKGMTGELTPEMLKQLNDVALQYGYDSSDALFLDLFGTGDREKALQMFLENAEFAAGLTPQVIARATERIVTEHFKKGGVDSGSSFISQLLATLKRDQYSLEEFFVQDPGRLSKEQKKQWDRLGKLIEKYTKGQRLTPNEFAEMDDLLLKLSRLLVLYMQLGPEFFALRQSEGLKNFLVEASRYGEKEDLIEDRAAQKGITYQRLIPRQLSSRTSKVMVLRFTVETRQIETAKRMRSPRHNDALLAMIAARVEKQIADEDFISAYQAMAAAEFEEAGITNQLGEVAALQARSPWAARTKANAGGSASGTAQMLAMMSGGGNPGKGKLAANILSNPAAKKAMLRLLVLLAPKLAAAGAIGLVAYAAAKPILDLMSSLGFFGGGGGSAAATALGTSGIGSSVAAEVSTAVADGGSKAMIAAKSGVQEVVSTLGPVGQGAVTTTTKFIAAVTTTAAVSGTIVATGIIAPMLGMIILTFIVWSVIGNSFNDYGGGGLGTVRRGLGIEGCWPTSGVITALRTYPNGSPHAVSPNGSAIDIGGDALEPVYTPFGGRARAYSVAQLAGTGNSGYGNYVRVKTDLGFDMIFAHLEAYEVSDTSEVVVQAGDLIGGMGSTGTSTGNHLHYELIDLRQRGLEIFDITPLPEAEMRLYLPVSATECTSNSVIPTGTESPAPATSPSGSGLDPMDLVEDLDLPGLTPTSPTTP